MLPEDFVPNVKVEKLYSILSELIPVWDTFTTEQQIDIMTTYEAMNLLQQKEVRSALSKRTYWLDFPERG